MLLNHRELLVMYYYLDLKVVRAHTEVKLVDDGSRDDHMYVEIGVRIHNIGL